MEAARSRITVAVEDFVRLHFFKAVRKRSGEGSANETDFKKRKKFLWSSEASTITVDGEVNSPKSISSNLQDIVDCCSESPNAVDTLLLEDHHRVVAQLDQSLQTEAILGYFQQLVESIPEWKQQSMSAYKDKTEESCSVVGSISYQNLVDHLTALRTEYVVKLMKPLVEKLMENQSYNQGGIFNYPINLPNYTDYIDEPMDLGTIKSRLQRGHYRLLYQCVKDVDLVFRNAMTYNPPNSPYHSFAKHLLAEFKKAIVEEKFEDKCVKEIERKLLHECSLCSGSTCMLCGDGCLKFEPLVVVCQGNACGGKRIKRNGTYFIAFDGQNTQQWCQQCYNNLPAVIMERPLPQTSLLKKQLLKRKADEDVAEPWVKCDTCQSWVHQICALYNSRQPENFNGFVECPLCKLQLASQSGLLKFPTLVPSSSKTSVCSVDDDCNMLLMDSRTMGNSQAATRPNKTYDIFKSFDSGVTDYEGMVEDASIGMDGEDAHQNGSETTGDDSEDDFSHDTAAVGTSYPSFGSSTNKERAADETYSKAPVSPLCHRSSPSSIRRSQAASSETDFWKWKASSLPHTLLGDFLETLVKNLLKRFPEFQAFADTITIRMVSNRDQKMTVPKEIVDNMVTEGGKRVPADMAYRQKCIMLFQNIDGLDVCLFTLYVQEFDRTCPAPNNSTVYISYLDSVDYFRPIEARTMVYHEIIVGYLKWAQLRGFTEGHIWACPPQRGDNFIFWCHPPLQKTPSRDRLNSWYRQILARSYKLGILSEVTNLMQVYFPTNVPTREDAGKRQAAKRSFVGSGKVSNRKSKRKTNDMNDSDSEVDESKLFAATDTLDEIFRTHSPRAVLAVASAPVTKTETKTEDVEGVRAVCPPVFEGDFWMREWVYKANKYRSRSNVNVDKSNNNRRCRDVLRVLMCRMEAKPFNQPVDPVALQIPDYPLKIKHPMDLGTARDKLRNGCYTCILDFVEDVRLTFRNAMDFNPAQSQYHIAAKQLSDRFTKSMMDLMRELHPGKEIIATSLDDLLGECKLGCQSPKAGDGSESLCSSDLLITEINVDRSSVRNDSPSNGQTDVDQVSTESPNTLPLRKVSECGESIFDFNSIAKNPEETVPGELLSRRESMDMTECGESNDAEDDPSYLFYRSIARTVNENENFCAHDFNKSINVEPFQGEPALGWKGLLSVKQEVTNRVNLLKDGLFVIKFAPPKTKGVDAANVPVTSDKKISRQRSKVSDVVSTFVKKKPTAGDSELPEETLQYTEGLQDDTSDPDPLIFSPLVDSRHTFLEMCQYRHYQFDTLRRAKHSSAMILYHLHNPYDKYTRPVCQHCGDTIQQVRWHCDECADFDLCSDCYHASGSIEEEERQVSSARSPKTRSITPPSHGESTCRPCGVVHPHLLTPFLVTYT